MSITDEMVIDCVIDDGPDDGISLLISIYDDPIEDAYTIYNRWKRLRTLMMRDKRFANTKYEDSIQELMTLSKTLDPTYFDLQLLQNLLLSSQVDRHNIQLKTRRDTFKSVEVFNLFKTIKPLNHSFYQFKLPSDIIDANFSMVHAIDLQKQKHQKSRSNLFEITSQQLLQWKNTALNYVTDTTYHIKGNSGYLISAIQLLCGRRLIEVLEKMDIIGIGPTRFSAKVANLAKEKSSIEGKDKESYIVIPLLCDYDIFKSSIQKIRELEPTSGAVRSYVFTKTSKASQDMFGQVLDHTIKRNIYCELCWLEKYIHNCYTTYSKKAFFGTILGHSLLNFDNTDQYTSLTVV